jgi:hypothetical protein
MRIRSLMVAPVLAAAVGAPLASGAHAMGGPCSAGEVLKSKSYVFALSIGPLEQMYTPAQVKAKHPKSGEVMFSGTMSGGMSGMGTSASSDRHLEVHICNTAGTVVRDAHPMIVVTDPKAKTMSMSVPIATMEGVTAGPSDYHYGNNVALTAGDKITVTVKLTGQSVVFHTLVSKTAMAMGG